jgi:hypothetical protein
MDSPMEPTWPEVIEAYWRHMERARAALPGRNTDMTDFWAWQAVDSVWAGGVPEAIDKLVQLADGVPHTELLNYLGGGPLEDLVQLWGGEYEAETVAAAERSPNFAAALRILYPTPTPFASGIDWTPRPQAGDAAALLSPELIAGFGPFSRVIGRALPYGRVVECHLKRLVATGRDPGPGNAAAIPPLP